MLTVQSLVRDLDLELVAGEGDGVSPVRWVHISELPDPTPWLSGGELLLTTGMRLDTPARQREFVARLARHQLAGLGFGTGFGHSEVPPALVECAAEQSFPVFEVPYALPFIAITEKAFARLVNEQYEVLQRGIAIHKRLERLVLDGRGLDEIVRAVSAAIGGAVVVVGPRGTTLAQSAFRRPFPAEALEAVRGEVLRRAGPSGRGAVAFAPDHADVSGRALALPVVTGGPGGAQGWLVAARETEGLGDFERLILQQTVTVVALELMRQRAMLDTERRLAGDVLAEAVAGRLGGDELARRLRPFGIGGRSAVIVFAVEDPLAAEPEVERAFGDAGIGALVADHDGLLCGVVDVDGDEPVALADRVRERLEPEWPGTRAAVSRSAPSDELRRSFHEARCALEATGLAGDPPPVASYRDLGAFQLLLSLQDDEALRLYCDSVLGPLENGGGDYGDELLRSLEAYIEHNGQMEGAARVLYCHRHTLRYRIKRIEQLTGRDLRRARDRIEFWLALRARELVR